MSEGQGAAMRRRRDPYSRTVVRLPERDLGEVLLEVAAPLLERLGPAPSLEEARATIADVIAFWNASVRASKLWGRPRVKELNELRKRMRGRHAPREAAATFDRLAEVRRNHWLDPRLVASWTYGVDAAGARRLSCTVDLPEGVEAEIPPPLERRIAIGGRYLDEVRIAQGPDVQVGFPVDRHQGAVATDGTATVRTPAATALQLFAAGHLPPVGAAPVEVVVGGRELGPMVLAALQWGGGELAILVFRPA